MARNHVPNNAKGIPPALDMAGRCDLLAGHAAAAWTHNPDPADPDVQVPNAVRNIGTTRAEFMEADEELVLKTCFFAEFFWNRRISIPPIGPIVQIATR